ncbi:MAG TPA: class I SAM-dependent methyltransferase [Polyangiaceae bacterium]|jgi:methyltransferase (TIGR00027 family)|nr:class I SAM-dependent methyltransferase [Polyangiaceae bacterium]
MLPQKPSRTAFRVASWRAAHQLLERPPLVLDDPLALRILGKEEEARLRATAWTGRNRASDAGRSFIVARARFAEDTLADAVRRGVAQYVVLGAGLDTFAYRNPYGASLRVFEVDHPATQAWKREQLATTGIELPANLSYAPTDFEKESVADGLARAGFSNDAPAFFSWLGVTMYLTEPALDATLAFIGGTAKGGGVVFDYMRPLESLPFFERFVLSFMARRVARVGEPFRTRLEPAAMHTHLERAGLRIVEDLDRNAVNARYFAARADGLRVRTSQARLLAAEI